MTDFDRLVDAAAKDIVARQPSPHLRHAVMSRVLRGNEPTMRRRIWLVAVPSAMACIVAAVFLRSGPLAPLDETMMLIQARSFSQPLAPAPALHRGPPPVSEAPAIVRNALARTAEPVTPTQPVQLELIGVETIDVPPIGPLSNSISTIDLANLTIEPLMASNN